MANGVIGVYSAVYDLEKNKLHIDYNKNRTSTETISKAVAAAGHDTNLHKADDAVYEVPPACCHYRKQKQLFNIYILKKQNNEKVFILICSCNSSIVHCM